mmetsp:Transcript_22453/g.53369  ORF Transcript_22453/g.53369 Transcript_22453/m.53369 type:complete len:421 (+) Transcript_22453:97-1359(+)|eukprot:CAMPEP_0197177098 /NCGR_PEP_ID=MMETSP1423-20130617/2825_1 /TAXON_ID=476441 /ORGANISM="Pseudo-nitzschia heimii, Strain UNC1101" /LENGTH=420 /DNA_ID=CAMNT_0042626593 /DNA_START=18 /DNA_END=1280 /DNA_ORIENTATION=-
MNDPFASLLGNCSIIPPSLSTWLYAISVHGGCTLLGGVPFGILLYHVLKKDAEGQQANGHAKGYSIDTRRTFVGVAVGSGAAASVYIGRPLLESFSPNAETTFLGPLLASTFGFTTFFKSFNVAFGTYPEGADKDLQTWLMWYTMLPEPTFAKGKLSKVTRKEVIVKLRDFVSKIIALFLILTVLMRSPPPYYQVMREESWSPSSHRGNESDGGNGFYGWFLAVHVNGFFQLWLLYSVFSSFLDFSTITNYICTGGIRSEPGFCNPLLESRSYKETWGTRWNRPINTMLKRTVYIPALKSGLCNRNVAAALTFFASGLLHEYNFAIHNHRSLLLSSGYRRGEVTVFFILMGLLMIGESWVWTRIYPRWLQTMINHLPSAVTASMLTFMVAGLAQRYFLRAWLQSGFVEAVAHMFPHLECS